MVGNLPELRFERRTHFRGRSRDGQRLRLRFRPLSTAGNDAGGNGEAEWVSTQARDIGLGGAFVATYRSLPVGTGLEVEVDLPLPIGGVALRAEVRWLAEPGRLPPGCDAGMGLAFEPLDVDALLALSDYLAGLAREKLER
ncbi:MAG TPA: PilZ domain-containing protein [Kofleriaceae bacterium]|nr:PilZ domain-containing protein [Kofleriaceae bacterium]